MNAVRLLPVLLSFLLLGAHFLRSGPAWLAALCVAAPLLLLLPRAWVPRVFTAALLLGALEWLRTLLLLVAERRAFDQPWGRLALILGAVAAFSALSAAVFRLPALRRRYRAREFRQRTQWPHSGGNS